MRLCFPLLSFLVAACSSGSEPTQVPTVAGEAPVAATATASSGAPVDTVRGFGRHHFGDPLRSFPLLTLVHQSRPDLVSYQLASANRPLHYGPIVPSRVMYTFYQQKLYGITIFAAGQTGLQHLLAEAKTRYGRPSQESDLQSVWLGKQVMATIGQSPLDSTETYYVKLLDIPMLHRLEEAGEATGSR